MTIGGAQHRFIAVYGMAHFGKSLFWACSELLFAYFLTEACGLAPRLMAAALGGSLALSAAADFGVGRVMAARVQTPAAAGRAQFFGAAISACAFSLFGLSGLLPQASRFAYALGAILLFRLSYSVFDVPQNALLALTTEDDAGRARLSSWRYVFGGAASIAVAGLFAPLFKGRLASVQAQNFALLAVALSLVALASAAGLLVLLRAGAAPVVRAAPGPRPAPQTVLGRGWRLALIFLMLALVGAAGSAFSKLEPYLAAYGLTARAGASAVLTSIALGNLVSQPVWAWFARRWSLLGSLRAAAVLLVFAAALIWLMVDRGTVAGVAAGAFYGFGMGGVTMSLWALAAAASGKTRWLGGATSTFGLVTALSKLGSACAILSVGEVLAGSAYRDVASWGASLLLIMTLAPMAVGGACVVASFHLSARREAQ
jgi:Na+/melibiose symporter-like transporter